MWTAEEVVVAQVVGVAHLAAVVEVVTVEEVLGMHPRLEFYSVGGGGGHYHNLVIRQPQLFDNKKDKDFLNWVIKLQRYFSVIQLRREAWTATLLLYLGTDPGATARYFGFNDGAPWDEARRKLVAHFFPKEIPDEMRARFTYRKQNKGESLEVFAGDLRVAAARAFPSVPENILQLLLVQHFISGLRESLTMERRILKRCATLQEVISVARLSEWLHVIGAPRPQWYSQLVKATTTTLDLRVTTTGTMEDIIL